MAVMPCSPSIRPRPAILDIVAKKPSSAFETTRHTKPEPRPPRGIAPNDEQHSSGFRLLACVDSRSVQLDIRPADFGDPELKGFLQDHLDDIAPTAPRESRHALDLAALDAPTVRMWVGRRDGVLVVTGALVQTDGSGHHEEVKSMRTAPSVRGRGFGRQMVEHLIHDARHRGVERLWLETGSMPFFEPARALYRSMGFIPCPPFASYAADPNSTFMTRDL